jgi:hypothetical protein
MATLSDFYYGDDPRLSQYYLGSGVGATRFNQNYRPTTRFMSRGRGPESLYLNNMGVFAPTQMGDFTPSAGLMGEMQPLSAQPPVQVAPQVALQSEQPMEAQPQTFEQAYGGAAPQRTSGLLGDMFGGASALDEYMTPEQRAQLQNQGLMAAAMQLLASSGPSRVPVGLGQALGEAYGAGQKGYTAAQQNLLTSMTMKQKMDEAKATKGMQATVSTFLAQKAPEGVDTKEFKAQQYMKLADVYAATNPEQAAKFFDMAQKLMPAADKPVGEPFRAADGQFYQRTESGGVKLFGGGTVTPAAKPSGQPQMQLVNGVPKMVQYYEDGTRQVLEGVSQYNAPSTSITDLEILTGQSLAGTGAPGVAQVQDYRKSATAQQNVRVDTGDKTRTVEINKDIVAEMGSLTAQARAAKETLMNVDRVLPALDKAITGPLADYRTTLTRVGQYMGIAGKDANEILSNTQNVVQGLAQQELNAASYTKGQGTLTGPEREMLKRSAAGDQNMSAAELRTALIAAQKMAQYRIGEQQQYLSKFSALPGSEQYVPFYTVTPYQPAGSGNAAQSAIDAELAKRAQTQRGGGMR